MKSTQVQEDIEKWSAVFNDMCDGEEPDYKGHWDLRMALQHFANHIGGFNKQENEEARHLIDKLQHYVDLKKKEKARQMESEFFYFILKVVDK